MLVESLLSRIAVLVHCRDAEQKAAIHDIQHADATVMQSNGACMWQCTKTLLSWFAALELPNWK